jgi:hypothetical protein
MAETATKDEDITTTGPLDTSGVDEAWDDEGPGGSVEDHVESPEDQQAIDSVNSTDPEPIPGASKQLSLIAGGEEPDSATFKMRGGSIPVEGEFEKGSTIKVEVTLSVDEIQFVDKKDKDGYVVATERRHIGKTLSIRRL